MTTTQDKNSKSARADLRLAGMFDRVNLQSAIESLPEGYKRMFLLHDLHGYEHNEIAANPRLQRRQLQIPGPQSPQTPARSLFAKSIATNRAPAPQRQRPCCAIANTLRHASHNSAIPCRGGACPPGRRVLSHRVASLTSVTSRAAHHANSGEIAINTRITSKHTRLIRVISTLRPQLLKSSATPQDHPGTRTTLAILTPRKGE